MSSTDVARLMRALRDGEMSLEEVAGQFRSRKWPVTRRPLPSTYTEMAGQQDVEPDMPGSFDEVIAAYDRGDITRAQYRALAHAVADAIDAAAGRAGTDGGTHRVS